MVYNIIVIFYVIIVRVGIASPAIGRCRSICDAGYKLLMAIINIVIKKVVRPWSVVRDLKIFIFIYFYVFYVFGNVERNKNHFGHPFCRIYFI